MDYMHSVCKLIHTDIKPENVVFAMSQEEEFDLLYKHVFCTPLIMVYDKQADDKKEVALTKNQLKNQKKRQKKKHKQTILGGAGAADDKSDEEERKEDTN